MKQKLAQMILRDAGFYKGSIDGDIGSKSKAAAHEYFMFPDTWSSEKIYTGVIQVACIRSNIPVGEIDGLWGRNTQRGYEQLLGAYKVTDDSVKVNPIVDTKNVYNGWPKQTYSEMVKFYGKVGENQTSLQLPYEMYLAWDKSYKVSKITCHEKVHDSLERIFKQTLSHYGNATIKELRLDSFGGCLNVRKMRGGSSWSMPSILKMQKAISGLRMRFVNIFQQSCQFQDYSVI